MKRAVSSSFFLSNHMRFFLLLLLFALVHDGQPTVFFVCRFLPFWSTHFVYTILRLTSANCFLVLLFFPSYLVDMDLKCVFIH